jgi:hypothetical protein
MVPCTVCAGRSPRRSRLLATLMHVETGVRSTLATRISRASGLRLQNSTVGSVPNNRASGAVQREALDRVDFSSRVGRVRLIEERWRSPVQAEGESLPRIISSPTSLLVLSRDGAKEMKSGSIVHPGRIQREMFRE